MPGEYCRWLVIVIISVCGIFTGCSNKSQMEREDVISVAVSIIPQKFFVEKIGGKYVDVTVMVEPGSSPHFYEPKPAQIIKLSKARFYFSIGIEFEKAWLPRFIEAAENLTIVPCDSGIEKLPMISSHADHDTDENNEEVTDDSRGNKDPHVWLSPELVKGMVNIITAKLCSIDSTHRIEYQKNSDYLLMEIQELQDSIRMNLQESNIKQFIVFHPAWGYFAHEFGLQQIPIEIEGKEPMPKELRHLLDIAGKNKITTIFVQPQFSQKTAGLIALQIGGTVIPIDPLAYNWRTNLSAVTHALVGR